MHGFFELGIECSKLSRMFLGKSIQLSFEVNNDLFSTNDNVSKKVRVFCSYAGIYFGSQRDKFLPLGRNAAPKSSVANVFCLYQSLNTQDLFRVSPDYLMAANGIEP